MAGTAVSTPDSSNDTIRQALASLGDSNIAAQGVTFGRVVPGLAGKLDAAYAVISTSSAKGYVYDVPHDLGHEPGWIIAVHQENTQTPVSHYHVIGWERDKWTATNARVHINVITGSLDGGQVTLMLAGRR